MKAITTTVLLALFSWTQSLACDCGYTTIKTSYENSDAVFIGNVLELKQDSQNFTYTHVVVEQKEIFKGAKNETLTLLQTFACDKTLKNGEKYLIFVYKDKEGFWRCSVCSKTQLFTDVKRSELIDLMRISKTRKQYAHLFNK